jgi:Tol biopolymer transport system component
MTDKTRYANLYLVPAGGGAPRRITADHAASLSPAWSRDGRWIYYSRGRTDFWKIPWNGGTPILVAEHGGRMDPQLSEDGQNLYYMGETMKGGVRRLDLTSGAETVIAGTEQAVFRNWALSRDGVYFVEGAAHPALRFLNFSMNRVTQLAPSRKTNCEQTRARDLARRIFVSLHISRY